MPTRRRLISHRLPQDLWHWINNDLMRRLRLSQTDAINLALYQSKGDQKKIAEVLENRGKETEEDDS